METNGGNSTTIKKTLCITAAIGAAVMFGVKLKEEHELRMHRLANIELADELMHMEFTNDFDLVECSAEALDPAELIAQAPDETVQVGMYPTNIDLSVPGKKSVNYFLEYRDDLDETHRKQIAKSITVQDTKEPIIDAREELLELWQYASFDENDYIESVKDDVSGELAKADEIGPGKYIVESDVNTDEPGKYTVNIKAEDLHGNTAERSFEVAVYEKKAAAPVQSASSGGSAGAPAASATTYSEPAPANVVNFDAYFPFSNCTGGGYSVLQGAIDAGYVALDVDDYYHHNTGAFMNLFWSCSQGTTVIIGGRTYTCNGIVHGYLTDDAMQINTDGGAPTWQDGIPQIITCDGVGNGRWIMYLH